MNQPIDPYCIDRYESIKQHFSFLTEKHGYQLHFLKRQGRFNSECVFGMEAEGMPKFQFGGETGDYVAVAVSSSPYSLESEGGVFGPWLYIEGLNSFLSGGTPLPWLEENIMTNQFNKWEELAEMTIRLLPWIVNTFSHHSVADKWRIEYDKACDVQTAKWLL